MQLLHLQRSFTDFNEVWQQYDSQNMGIQHVEINFKVRDWILHPKERGVACQFQMHRSTLPVGDDLGAGAMDVLLGA